jgi:hypothetical protein
MSLKKATIAFILILLSGCAVPKIQADIPIFKCVQIENAEMNICSGVAPDGAQIGVSHTIEF